MREVLLPTALSTGIGSLPHTDPRLAARFACDCHPRLPAAPSLPQRSPSEGMIPQGAWGIPGISVLADGSLLVDESGVDPDLPLDDPGIDGEPFTGMRAFLDLLAAAPSRVGPFKLQLTGPVTLGLALHAVGVDAGRAFPAAQKAVTSRIASALAAARVAAPGATPVMFIDEPGLGAALQPGFPLGVGQTLDLVSSAMAAVQDRAIVGLHCCGHADWQAVLQAGPQILSLPVGAGVVEYAGALTGFLEGGGWVAWGAVPTDGPLITSIDVLWRRLLAEWDSLAAEGCDPALLRARAIITPVCGLAGFDEVQARVLARLAGDLAHRLESHLAHIDSA
jgi:methionine synthase II (cobalamin-independent)